MPKLLSRSKHEEFESNSSLQIRSYKERRAKSEEQCTTAGMLFLRELFLPPSTVPSCSPYSPAFHAFVVFVTVLVFLLSTLVVITYVWIVWYFTWFVRLYKPFVYTVRRFFLL